MSIFWHDQQIGLFSVPPVDPDRAPRRSGAYQARRTTRDRPRPRLRPPHRPWTRIGLLGAAVRTKRVGRPGTAQGRDFGRPTPPVPPAPPPTPTRRHRQCRRAPPAPPSTDQQPATGPAGPPPHAHTPAPPMPPGTASPAVDRSAARRSRSSGGYLLDEPPDMTPSFPRTGVSGHAGAVHNAIDGRIVEIVAELDRDGLWGVTGARSVAGLVADRCRAAGPRPGLGGRGRRTSVCGSLLVAAVRHDRCRAAGPRPGLGGRGRRTSVCGSLLVAAVRHDSHPSSAGRYRGEGGTRRAAGAAEPQALAGLSPATRHRRAGTGGRAARGARPARRSRRRSRGSHQQRLSGRVRLLVGGSRWLARSRRGPWRWPSWKRPPAQDPASVGVGDKGHVGEPCPGRHIGEVCYPQNVFQVEYAFLLAGPDGLLDRVEDHGGGHRGSDRSPGSCERRRR